MRNNYTLTNFALGWLPFLWILYKNEAFVHLIDKGNGKPTIKEEPFVVHFLVGILVFFIVSAFFPIVLDVFPVQWRYALGLLPIMGIFVLGIYHSVKKKYYLALSTFIIFLVDFKFAYRLLPSIVANTCKRSNSSINTTVF
ncbi:hypothetical protein ACI760_02145 [Capnocytophaga canimorsus]|uniref:hypothetical protein n=1 Tax=Capnocytophaga canimorsus TaxID=28188 RepID=UPI0038584C8D